FLLEPSSALSFGSYSDDAVRSSRPSVAGADQRRVLSPDPDIHLTGRTDRFGREFARGTAGDGESLLHDEAAAAAGRARCAVRRGHAGDGPDVDDGRRFRA